MKLKFYLLFSLVILVCSISNIYAQTYYQLSSGSFTQNWTNTGLITANDDWSAIPNIRGYRGDDATASTGVDPQTLLLATYSTLVDVNANQTNPDTYTTGGVTEFEITDPVVALSGSGTADAPNLIIYLNTTGCSNIHVQFNVRDIDGSADNAIQQFALHYRVGNTGDFVNLPDGYIADATEGGTATLVTARDVLLPAACNNQANVEIRFVTTNAVGNDEYIGIDDIVIQQITSPVISVTSPSAGNQWKQGSTHNITWSASNTNANVKIEFTGNASAGTPTWSTLAASVAANSGTWTWNIPAAQPLSSDCKIRITDIPQTALGLSGTFSIIPPPLAVPDIATLRSSPLNAEYTLSGEAILTFQQTFRHQKYIQDETAGILIDDNSGLLTHTYNVGDGITGITGSLAEFGNMLQFTPIEDAPAATSTGNTITPEVITMDELVNNFDAYESELVKINFCQFANPGTPFANGQVYPVTEFNGETGNFRTTFYDVDYITTNIPSGFVDIVCLPNARAEGNFFTARNLADITVSGATSNDIVISEIYYNPPDGGNDTIEFIELYNRGTASTNMKDWYLSGAVQYTFPDVSISSNGYYLIARDAVSFNNTFGMTAAQWTSGLLDDFGALIELYDNNGFLKDSVNYKSTAPWPTEAAGNGPSINLCDPNSDNALGENWSAAMKFVGVNGVGDSLYATPGGACTSGANIVITEIMYNSPESGTDSLEFVELFNNGATINMLNFSINDAFVYTFPDMQFNSGTYMLLAVSSAAMQNTFGVTSIQWTSGALNNTSETITLKDLYGEIIDQVTYSDHMPWDSLADGTGPSLTLCDPNSNNALPEFWKSSTEFAAVNAANDSIFATPGTGCINPPPITDFSGNPTTLIEGGSVQFTDLTTNSPIAWEWTFEGGVPSTSTEQNPLITYPAFGVYPVTLKSSNAYGTDSLTKTEYINVDIDGIKPIDYNQVFIYPNPAQNEFKVVNNKKFEMVIEIYNSSSKLIESRTSSDTEINFNIADLASGLYLVKIINTANYQTSTHKLIVK